VKNLAVSVVVLAFVAAASSLLASRSDVNQRRERLNSFLAREWERLLSVHPEIATHAGDYRFNDKLSDVSAAAALAEIAHAKAVLPEFESIDTTGFPQQEQFNKLLMVRSLKERIESERFREWEMPVNQFNGIHLDLAAMVSDTPFRSVKDYDDYVARLRQSPRLFDQVIANMRLGAKDGLMPPRYLLEKVAVQAQEIASDPLDKSPFTQPAFQFPSSISETERTRLKAAIFSAVTGQVAPAYAKFAEFVRTEYALKGRTEFGVWALPEGRERYRFAIRSMTTTNLGPDEIHQLGLKQVDEIEREMLTIAQREGFDDLKSFNEHIRADRRFYAKSGEQLLSLYRQYADAAQTKLPNLFERLPKNKLAVVPMEAYRQPDAVPADYSIGAGDNSRPGRINVNEYNPEARLLLNVEAIAYHEGVPGHHLQFSIAQELADLPPFRKFEVNYNAYSEGWALYSERLGKEVGLYKDPYSDYGRLQAEMWRAVRLVVDTGVHEKHWSRQQMVDFFHRHTAMDEPNIQTEVDRYIAWPAQALSYKLGQMKIIELRERARKELGSKFDIRQYHDAVLDSGALPLDVLDTKVSGWIQATRTQH
jgi:uncharacterized protein (DUF885 family)